MLDEIYNKRVLELAADIPRLGRLAGRRASAKAHSRLCGSTVIVDLCVRDGRVSDFAHDVRACALGQASSSLMARHVIGATPEELVALRETHARDVEAERRAARRKMGGICRACAGEAISRRGTHRRC